MTFSIQLDEEAMNMLAEKIAGRLQAALPEPSPWMDFKALVDYTSIPEGTLRKMSAAGEIRSHGGRTRLYHRDEVDEDLLGYSPRKQSARLRRVS